MREGLEAQLRRRFEVREAAFAHGDWSAELILPRAADALIDEADFDADERLPYWAELWPSARGLARWLLDAPEVPASAVELGCGVGLPSLALRRRGVDVLATDWYVDALLFARANAERNRLGPLRTAPLDWRHPPDDLERPLVVAADVLYEARNARAIAELLPRILAPGGMAVLADPERVYARDFRATMAGAGWRVEDVATYTEPSAEHATSRVTILRVRR